MSIEASMEHREAVVAIDEESIVGVIIGSACYKFTTKTDRVFVTLSVEN